MKRVHKSDSETESDQEQSDVNDNLPVNKPLLVQVDKRDYGGGGKGGVVTSIMDKNQNSVNQKKTWNSNNLHKKVCSSKPSNATTPQGYVGFASLPDQVSIHSSST